MKFILELFPDMQKKKNLTFLALFVFSLSLFLSPNALFAEEQSRDLDYLRGQKEIQETISETSQEAKQRRILEGSRFVTYEEILQDPDNIDLNYQFAQHQIVQGDVIGAAATLERLLLVDPTLHRVRLLYAVVLYRLDNILEADRALAELESLEMPDSLRAEIGLYRKLIDQRKKQTRFTLRQTVGFGIDTNRNAAPSSKFRLLAEIPIGLTGTNRKRRDTHFMTATSLGVVHELSGGKGHEIFGSVGYFQQEQTNVDSLDVQSFSGEVGGTYKTRFVNITPSYYASHVQLSRETFIRSQGGKVRMNKNFKKWTLASSFLMEQQDFTPTEENTTNRQRKGRYLEWEGKVSRALIPTMRISGQIGYGNKSAEEDFNAYERMFLGVTHTWLLGRGQFLVNDFEFARDYYDEPETSIAGRKRRDATIRYRVTYGAPLETLYIGRVLPGPFKNILASAGFEYFRSLSNITNYTYKNFKYQFLLSKTWNF